MKKIKIKGVIVSNDYQEVYDWFGIEATSPRIVERLLEEADDDDELEIEINSGGGSVAAGSEIYTTIKDHKGKVTVKIVGIAASAASVIAMAGNDVKISPTAQIMIHNVSAVVRGDYRDLKHEADVLENYNKSISNAYRLKTNMEEKELLELMNKETWLNAQQSKELGFVDGIMFDESDKLVASVNTSTFMNAMLPQEVIDKVKNELRKSNKKPTETSQEPEKEPEKEDAKKTEELQNIEVAKARLNLALSI